MEHDEWQKRIRRVSGILVLVGMVAGCTPSAPPVRPAGAGPASAPVSFYFVQMSDTHWGARDGLAMTRSAVGMINALPVKIEFVTITGDIISDSSRKADVMAEGLAVMKGLKVPVYYVPGNHDLVKGDVAETSVRFEKNLGPLNRAVDIEGVLCLFVCTEMKEGQARHPAEVEREWIDNTLRGNRTSVLLFMHRPPLYNLVNGSDGVVSWEDEYDARWKSFFDRHPEIKAVFAGHFHRDVMGWIGDVPVYVAPAMARFWDRQPSFRLYRYQNGRLNYWTLYPERSAIRSQAVPP